MAYKKTIRNTKHPAYIFGQWSFPLCGVATMQPLATVEKKSKYHSIFSGNPFVEEPLAPRMAISGRIKTAEVPPARME